VTELRPHQTKAIEGIRAALQEGAGRILLVAPTGFGKTITIVVCVLGHLQKVPDGRVLVLVHRHELIVQMIGSLRGAGIPVSDIGVLQGDTCINPNAVVLIASVPTLASRGDRPRATFVVWDEAHHCPAHSFRAIHKAYPDALHLGATATPMRSDDKPLGDMFDRMVIGASIKELTRDGWLTPSELLSPTNETQNLAMDPIDAYRLHTPGRSAVIFGSSVEHARQLAKRANDMSIEAECVDGATEKEVRTDALERFNAGKVKILTNCFVLTEGWDSPIADVCILARRFSNVASYLQGIGRVLRPHPRKSIATILDLYGCWLTNGLPDEDRKWQLKGKACLRTEKMTSLKRCTECLAVFRVARKCPRCGAVGEKLLKIPRTMKRAERLEIASALPRPEQDKRYLWSLYNVARKRLRIFDVQAARDWAMKQFERQKGRKPEASF